MIVHFDWKVVAHMHARKLHAIKEIVFSRFFYSSSIHRFFFLLFSDIAIEGAFNGKCRYTYLFLSQLLLIFNSISRRSNGAFGNCVLFFVPAPESVRRPSCTLHSINGFLCVKRFDQRLFLFTFNWMIVKWQQVQCTHSHEPVKW